MMPHRARAVRKASANPGTQDSCAVLPRVLAKTALLVSWSWKSLTLTNESRRVSHFTCVFLPPPASYTAQRKHADPLQGDAPTCSSKTQGTRLSRRPGAH